jgi:hypothetical protein
MHDWRVTNSGVHLSNLHAGVVGSPVPGGQQVDKGTERPFGFEPTDERHIVMVMQ